MKTVFSVGAVKRILLFMLTIVFTFFFFLANAPATHALAPLELKESITDPQNILADKKSKIQESIKEVKDKTNQNIWIVFIPSFELGEEDVNGDSQIDSQDWIQETASKSNLGDSDVLLAVAISTHEMAVWISKDSNFLKSRSLDIITNGTMHYLRQAQYGEAVLKFNTSVLRQVESSVDYSPYIIVALLITVLTVSLIVSGVMRNAKTDSLSFFKKVGVNKELKSLSNLSKTAAGNLQEQNILQSLDIEEFILPSAQKQADAQVKRATTHISNTSEASAPQAKSVSSNEIGYPNDPVFTTPSVQTAQSVNVATGINNQPSDIDTKQYHPQNSTSGRIPATPQGYLPKSDASSAPKSNTSSKNATFFASDAITSKSSALNLRAKTSTIANNTTSTSTVEDIYGRYYKQSPSRELYGSYYSDGQAAKHDAQVNKQLLERDNYLSQKYSSQVKNIIKTEDESTKVYDKYYKNSQKNSFKKRFGI